MRSFPQLSLPTGPGPLACRLAAVESIPDERVLVLVLPRVRGRGRVVRIVLNLVPKLANATIVEGEDWTVRHILAERGGGRAPRVGRPYAVPNSTRRGLEAPLSLEEWLGVLGPEEPEARVGVLLRSVAVTSPINVGACSRAGRRRKRQHRRSDLASGHALWLRLRGIALGPGSTQATGAGDPSAELVDGTRSVAEAYLMAHDRRASALPRPPARVHVPRVSLPCGSGTRSEKSRRPAAPPDSFRADRRAGGRPVRRPEADRQAPGTAGGDPEPVDLRSKGDLILSYLGRILRGDSDVTLPGFRGEEVPIALDPALAPQENAARYYDRAGRAERAIARLPDLIRASEDEEATLSALRERVERGGATAEEVRDVVPEQGLRGRGPRTGVAPALPYRAYQTSGAIEVRVGRGSAANDDLTFRHSRPDDVWLHAVIRQGLTSS